MNQLIQSLINVCRQHPLEEKWLIAPSLRIGHQWIESVARCGQNVVNVKPKTFKGIAVNLALPEITHQNQKLLSDAAGWILIDHVWNCVDNKSTNYLFSLSPTQSLFQNIFRSLNDIRLAGLQLGQIHKNCFESDLKGKEIETLLVEYLQELESRNLVDYADVLRMAKKGIANNETCLPEDLLILVPADLRLCALEKELHAAIPQNKIKELLVDQTSGVSADQEIKVTDASLLRFVMDPATAPPPHNDRTALIFRAIGETNEVKKVLRMCLSRQVSLDDVEILHTDADTYIPLIYETIQKLQKSSKNEADFSINNFPVTFAEGIPARYTRPGRALQRWLDWISEDYPQKVIFQMIREGLLEIQEIREGNFSFTSLAKAFRTIGIGLGRNRYVKKINEKIEALKTGINTDSKGHTDDSIDISLDSKDKLRSEFEAAQIILKLINKLLEISSTVNSKKIKSFDAAIYFLKNCARCGNEFDNYARMALIEEIEKFKHYCDNYTIPSIVNITEWLHSLPATIKVLGSGPRSGCLHVANIYSGGHSGRGNTFIVGLDDGRFPGAGLQDPILLDEERNKLSAHLQTASEKRRENLNEFVRLLGRLRGTIVLSYSCRDILEDREKFPGSVVLNAYRILSGKKDGDLGSLLRWLGAPASFAPENPEESLTETEWWLKHACGADPVENVNEIIFNRFPHIENGFNAKKMRSSPDFTIYDGSVERRGIKAKALSGSKIVFSAHKLETAGTCPLRYFFKFVLEIEPPEELEVDPERWLDPLQKGSLLHEVFYKFMNLLLRQKIQPVFERDKKQINVILDELVEWYRRKYPPPNEIAFSREYAGFKRIVKIFLQEQELICRESEPVYLESVIGMEKYETGSEFDTPKPVSLKLPDGLVIKVRGRIDRIDRLSDAKNSFIIYDYKTGSSNQYEKLKDPFNQGRIVQHWLYSEAAETRLKEVESANSHVVKFAYFFPGPQGRGKCIEWAPGNLVSGGKIIERLYRTISEGCFIATNNLKDCTYCPYIEICDTIEEVVENSEIKLQNLKNLCLEPFRELRKK